MWGARVEAQTRWRVTFVFDADRAPGPVCHWATGTPGVCHNDVCSPSLFPRFHGKRGLLFSFIAASTSLLLLYIHYTNFNSIHDAMIRA